ncbi:MAG TPA: hypothetical protein VII95_19570 [Terriglobales bacterium]
MQTVKTSEHQSAQQYVCGNLYLPRRLTGDNFRPMKGEKYRKGAQSKDGGVENESHNAPYDPESSDKKRLFYE